MTTNVKIVTDWSAVDYSDIKLPIFTVYDRPADFPNNTVIRLFDGASGHPTNAVMLCASLEEARAAMTGYTCIPRTARDQPQIVESYI